MPPESMFLTDNLNLIGQDVDFPIVAYPTDHRLTFFYLTHIQLHVHAIVMCSPLQNTTTSKRIPTT